MNHKCDELKSELSYWFTQENPGDLPEELRRETTVCPDCREHLLELRQSMKVLSTIKDDASVILEKSLWPQIQQRIKSLPVKPALSETRLTGQRLQRGERGRLLSSEQTNVWSRRIAVVSISLALLTVISGPLWQFYSISGSNQATNSPGIQHPQYEFARFDDPVPHRTFSLFTPQNQALYRDASYQKHNTFQPFLNQNTSSLSWQQEPVTLTPSELEIQE